MPQLIYKALGPLPPSSALLPATLDRIDGLDEPLTFEHGPCLRFVFSFVNEAFARRQATLLTSTQLTEGSRLEGVVKAMLERDLEDGEDITDDLKNAIGQTFYIVVAHRKRGHSDATFVDVESLSRVPDAFA